MCGARIEIPFVRMFKFEWSALSPDDEKRAQDFLNQSFANIPNKPDVVGDIYVTDLTFGSVPPVVELLDISIIPDDVKEIIIRHNQHSTAGTRVESKDFDVDRVGHPHGHVRGYEEEVETEDDDVQILMKVSYNGDAKFSIHTELVINWPQAGFGRLPISLHVNKCHFDGIIPFWIWIILFIFALLFARRLIWIIAGVFCSAQEWL